MLYQATPPFLLRTDQMNADEIRRLIQGNPAKSVGQWQDLQAEMTVEIAAQLSEVNETLRGLLKVLSESSK